MCEFAKHGLTLFGTGFFGHIMTGGGAELCWNFFISDFFQVYVNKSMWYWLLFFIVIFMIDMLSLYTYLTFAQKQKAQVEKYNTLCILYRFTFTPIAKY